MKRVLSFLLAASLCFVLFPSFSFAAIDESELESYLVEIDVSEEELIEYLEFHGFTLEDFESKEELEEFLGPVVTEEALNDLLADYELTKEELIDLLVEYGELEVGEEITDVYTFIYDLEEVLLFMIEEEEWTPITDENLQSLLDRYGLTKAELEALLVENDDSLENYEFIEELDFAVDFYVNFDGEIPDFSDLFTDLGLTEEELEKLFEHFMSIEIDEPEMEQKMIELEERMIYFEDFESADELTEEEIAELLAIYQELQILFQLNTEFYLVTADNKTPVSFTTLMALTELNDANLVIELYSTQGELLADFVLTAEMFSGELIQETGEDLKEAEEVIETAKQVPQMPGKSSEAQEMNGANEAPVKTVKGAKLPKTASNFGLNMMIGLIITFAGAMLYRKMKVKGA